MSSTSIKIFLGGVTDLTDLIDPLTAATLVTAGDIGLYGHVNGIFSLYQSGVMGAVTTLMKPYGSGVSETGADPGFASATVTLANNTAQSQRLFVGAILQAANGSLFQVVSNVNAAPSGYDLASGRYYYQFAANSSFTVPVEATQLGAATNIAANSLTGFASASPFTILGSSAATGGQAWTSTQQNGLVETSMRADGSYTTYNGFLSSTPGNYTTIYTSAGYAPAETNVNVVSNYSWTDNDLAAWKGYVDNARAQGIMNVAPIWSDNNYNADLSIPFAISPWYANVRAAALYGGGLSFDLPPSYAFARAASYLRNIEQQIIWANQNGLRTSVIVSPSSAAIDANGYDNSFMADTKKLVSILQAAGAMPSQFIVENYRSSGDGNTFTPHDGNSLTDVAAYLGGLALTSTNSENGLETAGATRPADMIVTGAEPTLKVSNAATPFANATVFASNPGATLTSTVHLSSVAGGTLSGPTGSFSSNGDTATFTGTAAQITAGLDALKFKPVSGYSGTITATIQTMDATGTITSTTLLDVETAKPSAPVFLMNQDTLVLGISEDAWSQDAQFTVSVNGKQIGGVYTTTALHSIGQNQDFVLTGQFGPAPTVAVTFLNDIYGGTPATDTNLYLNAVTIDGQKTVLGLEQASAGTLSRTFAGAPTLINQTPAGAFITNTGTPRVAGTGQVGAVMFVSAVDASGKSTTLGITTVDQNGLWGVTSAAPLADGRYTLLAIQADGLGALSPVSSQTLVIDTHVPAAPTVSTPQLSQTLTPTITGTAEAGATVIVTAAFGGNSIPLGSAIADGNGLWSLTTTSPLAEGSYQVSATQTDQAGTVSARSGQQGMLVDAHIPNAPAIMMAADVISLNVSADWFSEAAKFTVTVDGQQLAGTYGVTALHSLGQSQTFDFVGNFGTGPHTVAVNFLNDVYAGTPATDTNLYVNSITADGSTVVIQNEQPSIGSVSYQTLGGYRQILSTGTGSAVTDISQPTLLGTADPGNLVTVYAQVGGIVQVLGTTTATATGSWSLTAPISVPDGTYRIQATQTDAIGGTSAAGAWQNATINTQVQPAPALAVGLDTLTLNMSADWWLVGAQFTVTVDGQQIGGTNTVTAKHDAGASDVFTINGHFAAGQHQVAITFLNDVYAGTPATDTNLWVNSISLNGSTVTENAELKSVGTQQFAIGGGGRGAATPDSGTTVVAPGLTEFTGTASAGASVAIYGSNNAGNILIGNATTDSSGHWDTWSSTPLQAGSYQISAIQTNGAGLSSAPSTAKTLVVAPNAPDNAAIPTVFDGGSMTFLADNSVINIVAGGQLQELGHNNRLMLPGSGSVSIAGDLMNNNDVLDLRNTLSAVGWNGDMSRIGGYETIGTSANGQDMVVSFHDTAGHAGLQMTLVGQGGIAASAAANPAMLLQHVILS
ncbi:beta strand repeat-containing protein [Rhizosaccharibacter radicis]|uniref:Ig-like domain-containing protein n=1 Tax=Rhizosaccharibacter radicis TaxID=2782605 RepID=A0ABT1VUW4_9PROT|nr:Ig-like domain-containing protein [Acetobacteraceae bacterium KSS12]